MRPDTKGFLKQMAICVPTIVLSIILVNLVLSGADMIYPGLGDALGIGLTIAVIAGTALAIERGWLD